MNLASPTVSWMESFSRSPEIFQTFGKPNIENDTAPVRIIGGQKGAYMKTTNAATVNTTITKRERPKAILSANKPSDSPASGSADLKKSMNPPVSAQTETVSVFSKDFVTKFKKHDAAIRKGFRDAGKSYVTIACNLYWIYVNQAYKTAGMDTIQDYAAESYDIGKSTAYSYIQIAERFCRKISGSDDYAIREEFAAYSPSQLAILAPLTDEAIVNLKVAPTMSCREIKKLVSSSKRIGTSSSLDTQDTSDTEPSRIASDTITQDNTESDTDTAAPGSPLDNGRNVLITLKGKDDYIAHENDMFDLLHNLLSKKPDAVVEIAFYQH